jgi:hypothetical protein
MILFVIAISMVSKRNKICSAIFSTLLVFVLFFFVCAGQFILDWFVLAPRMLLAFGVFLSLLAIPLGRYTVNGNRLIRVLSIVCILAINWCFVVWTSSVANGMADQQRYIDFRHTLLLNDLSSVFPERESKNMTLLLKGWIGAGPVLVSLSNKTPMAWNYFYYSLREAEFLSNFYLLYYFKDQQIRPVLDGVNALYDKIRFDEYENMNLPVVKDTYYHTIRSDGEHIFVELKRGGW